MSEEKLNIMNKKNNSTQEIDISLKQPSYRDLILFKEDILKELKDYKTTLTNTVNAEFNKYSELLEKSNNNLNNYEKDKNFFMSKMDFVREKDKLFIEVTNKNNELSNEVMINTLHIAACRKDIDDSCYKYDKIISNNLLVPGLIGTSCKFQNLKEYILYNKEEINNAFLNNRQNTSNINILKKKTETVAGQLNANFKSLEFRLSNYMASKYHELDGKFDILYDELNKKMNSLNHSISSNLDERNNEIVKLKNYVLEENNKAIENMKEIKNDVLNEFNVMKTNFKKIKKNIVSLSNLLMGKTYNMNRQLVIENFNKMMMDLIKETISDLKLEGFDIKNEILSNQALKKNVKPVDSLLKKYIEGKISVDEAKFQMEKKEPVPNKNNEKIIGSTKDLPKTKITSKFNKINNDNINNYENKNDNKNDIDINNKKNDDIHKNENKNNDDNNKNYKNDNININIIKNIVNNKNNNDNNNNNNKNNINKNNNDNNDVNNKKNIINNKNNDDNNNKNNINKNDNDNNDVKNKKNIVNNKNNEDNNKNNIIKNDNKDINNKKNNVNNEKNDDKNKNYKNDNNIDVNNQNFDNNSNNNKNDNNNDKNINNVVTNSKNDNNDNDNNNKNNNKNNKENDNNKNIHHNNDDNNKKEKNIYNNNIIFNEKLKEAIINSNSNYLNNSHNSENKKGIEFEVGEDMNQYDVGTNYNDNLIKNNNYSNKKEKNSDNKDVETEISAKYFSSKSIKNNFKEKKEKAKISFNIDINKSFNLFSNEKKSTKKINSSFMNRDYYLNTNNQNSKLKEIGLEESSSSSIKLENSSEIPYIKSLNINENMIKFTNKPVNNFKDLKISDNDISYNIKENSSITQKIEKKDDNNYFKINIIKEENNVKDKDIKNEVNKKIINTKIENIENVEINKGDKKSENNKNINEIIENEEKDYKKDKNNKKLIYNIKNLQKKKIIEKNERNKNNLNNNYLMEILPYNELKTEKIINFNIINKINKLNMDSFLKPKNIKKVNNDNFSFQNKTYNSEKKNLRKNFDLIKIKNNIIKTENNFNTNNFAKTQYDGFHFTSNEAISSALNFNSPNINKNRQNIDNNKISISSNNDIPISPFYTNSIKTSKASQNIELRNQILKTEGKSKFFSLDTKKININAIKNKNKNNEIITKKKLNQKIRLLNAKLNSTNIFREDKDLFLPKDIPKNACLIKDEDIIDQPLTNETNIFKLNQKNGNLENRIIELEYFTKKKFDELVKEIKLFIPIHFNSHIKNYVVDKKN